MPLTLAVAPSNVALFALPLTVIVRMVLLPASIELVCGVIEQVAGGLTDTDTIHDVLPAELETVPVNV